jgi:hypothetical protein
MKRLNNNYSSFVKKTKFIFAIIITFLVLLLVTFLLKNKSSEEFQITPEQQEVSEQLEAPQQVVNEESKKEDNNLVKINKPHFQGSTKDNELFNIRADSANEQTKEKASLNNIDAEIDLKDSKQIKAYSPTGTYLFSDKILYLEKEVDILYDQYTKISTSSVEMNLDKKVIKGNEPVKIDGPMGKLQARDFNIVINDKKINLTGPVKLIISNKK